MRAILLALLFCGVATAAQAQSSDVIACNYDARGKVDYQSCADQARPGSPEQKWALINLGTDAFLNGDFATAVRFYDAAQPPGDSKKVFSDAAFHAFRGAAYQHVGRKSEALADAKRSRAMLRGEIPELPAGDTPADMLYPHILPILKDAGDETYAAALAEYLALPAVDWMSYANRAGVLTEVGEFDKALAASNEALRLEPDHPAVLNNACYLLTEMKKAAEGLAYCERAVLGAPDVAAVHDSYASALAALGRCAEADAERSEARRLDPSSVSYQKPLDCPAK